MEGILLKRSRIAKISLSSLCLIFIIGLILIFAAPSIGENARHTYVGTDYGGRGHDRGEIFQTTTTTSYQLGGLTIALVGGFGLVIFGYALYKEI